MSQAQHRIPPSSAYRGASSSFAPGRFQPRRRSPDDNAAAVAMVLSSALTFGAATGSHPVVDLAGPPDRERSDRRFDAAVALYIGRHWKSAFGELSALADTGHLRAAKLALLMMRYGVSLYDTTFAAQPGQVARWAQHVLSATTLRTEGGAALLPI
jgi:hypothetical protein